jgi:hypothetical protein
MEELTNMLSPLLNKKAHPHNKTRHQLPLHKAAEQNDATITTERAAALRRQRTM